jgi:hypothetical protein
MALKRQGSCFSEEGDDLGVPVVRRRGTADHRLYPLSASDRICVGRGGSCDPPSFLAGWQKWLDPRRRRRDLTPELGQISRRDSQDLDIFAGPELRRATRIRCGSIEEQTRRAEPRWVASVGAVVAFDLGSCGGASCAGRVVVERRRSRGSPRPAKWERLTKIGAVCRPVASATLPTIALAEMVIAIQDPRSLRSRLARRSPPFYDAERFTRRRFVGLSVRSRPANGKEAGCRGVLCGSFRCVFLSRRARCP